MQRISSKYYTIVVVVKIYDRGEGLAGLIGALWSGCSRWMDRLRLGLRLVLILILMDLYSDYLGYRYLYENGHVLRKFFSGLLTVLVFSFLERTGEGKEAAPKDEGEGRRAKGEGRKEEYCLQVIRRNVRLLNQ
jgi:hypothetical protein